MRVVAVFHTMLGDCKDVMYMFPCVSMQPCQEAVLRNTHRKNSRTKLAKNRLAEVREDRTRFMTLEKPIAKRAKSRSREVLKYRSIKVA